MKVRIKGYLKGSKHNSNYGNDGMDVCEIFEQDETNTIEYKSHGKMQITHKTGTVSLVPDDFSYLSIERY